MGSTENKEQNFNLNKGQKFNQQAGSVAFDLNARTTPVVSARKQDDVLSKYIGFERDAAFHRDNPALFPVIIVGVKRRKFHQR